MDRLLYFGKPRKVNLYKHSRTIVKNHYDSNNNNRHCKYNKYNEC